MVVRASALIDVIGTFVAQVSFSWSCPLRYGVQDHLP